MEFLFRNWAPLGLGDQEDLRVVRWAADAHAVPGACLSRVPLIPL